MIAIPITGEELTHQRDKVEGVLFVHPAIAVRDIVASA